MNKVSFQVFSDAYRASLSAAVESDPSQYAIAQGETPSQYADRVASKILSKIESGGHYSINYDSPGFRRTCKALGIKFTRKAILEYIGVQS